jgi:hypothetical protein
MREYDIDHEPTEVGQFPENFKKPSTNKPSTSSCAKKLGDESNMNPVQIIENKLKNKMMDSTRKQLNLFSNDKRSSLRNISPDVKNNKTPNLLEKTLDLPR